MKSKYSLTALLAVLLVLIVPIAVSATHYELGANLAPINAYHQNTNPRNWQFDTTGFFDAANINVDTVKFYYQVEGDPIWKFYEIDIKKIEIKKDNIVQLHLDPSQIPVTAAFVKVNGTLVNGVDTFSDQVPGYAMRRGK